MAHAIEENGVEFWLRLLQVAWLLNFAVVCYCVDPIVENDPVLAAAAVDGVPGSIHRTDEVIAAVARYGVLTGSS